MFRTDFPLLTYLEQAGAAGAVTALTVAWLVQTFRQYRSERSADKIRNAYSQLEDSLCSKGECIAILSILTLAVALRIFSLLAPAPYPISGGLVQVLSGMVFLADPNKHTSWHELLQSHGPGGWIYDSPILSPLYALLVYVFGASVQLAAIGGMIASVFSVILCWILGRILHGKVFGLLFASFAAVSPLQLVWSTLGFRAIWAPPHVLLITVLGYLAGRRHVLLILPAALLACLTIYNHDSARIGIGLAFAAPAVAAFTHHPVRRALFLLCLNIFFLLLVFYGFHHFCGADHIRDTFYPSSVGAPYAGHYGEKNPVDFVLKNLERFQTEGLNAITQLFVNRDSFAHPGGWKWGLEYGGILSLPMAFLGLVGFAYGLFFRREAHLIVVFLLASFAVPLLSCSTARRLLLVDIGWCALAAWGMRAILESRLVYSLSPRMLKTLHALFVLMLGLWSFVTIWVTSQNMEERDPNGDPQRRGLKVAPYTDGCTRDVTTCPRCFEVGRFWEQALANNKMVILFDVVRWNGSIPGGLSEYGILAAAKVGREDLFWEFYHMLIESNVLPTHRFHYTSAHPFYEQVEKIVARHDPKSIIWHFERPTAWERGFAKQLVGLGGKYTEFNTPLSGTPGFLIETSGEAMLRVLRMLKNLYTPTVSSSNVVEHVITPVKDWAGQKGELRVLGVINSLSSGAEPKWVAGTHVDGQDAIVGPKNISIPVRVWALAGEEHNGEVLLRLLDHAATEKIYNLSKKEMVQGREIKQAIWGSSELDTNCAAFAAGSWWIVEPFTGTLYTNEETLSYLHQSWFPRREWIAVAGDEKNRLMLGSADQEVFLLDLKKKEVIVQIAVPLLPTRHWRPNECTQITFGKSWFAVVNPVGPHLALYDFQGQLRLGLDLVSFSNTCRTCRLLCKGHEDYLAIESVEASKLANIFKVNLGQ